MEILNLKTISSNAAEYRCKAARSFRAARNAKNDAQRSASETHARGYKSLAAAEEWLMGVPQRSSTLPWLPRRVSVKA